MEKFGISTNNVFIITMVLLKHGYVERHMNTVQVWRQGHLIKYQHYFIQNLKGYDIPQNQLAILIKFYHALHG